MDHDLKDNSSDSDLSDSWTLLNCSEHDLTSQENCHVEASDDESVESFGDGKRELSKRDEESDGISIISESDICDTTETIPMCCPPLENDVPKSPYPAQCSSRQVQGYHDSCSESDESELVNVPADFSLCSMEGWKSRDNRLLQLKQMDTRSFVEDFPVLRVNSRIHDDDEPYMRIYVHRPNNHINYFLSILLALALAAVAGLGTGHFLGSKELVKIPEERVFRLQEENQMLHNRLHKLLGEHEKWRNDIEHIIFDGCRNVGKSVNFEIACSKNLNVLFLQRTLTFLNKSLLNNVPYSVIFQVLKSNSPNSNFETKIFKHGFKRVDTPLLSEQSSEKSLNFNSIQNKHVSKPSVDSHVFESIPKQFSEISPQISNEYLGKPFYQTEIKDLIDEVKSALAQGLELSNKLKETISYLDFKVGNWKNSKYHDIVPKTCRSNIEKKSHKGLKHIFHNSGKIKKLLSKTADKFDLIKRNIFKRNLYINFWEELIFKKNKKYSGPSLAVSDSMINDSHWDNNCHGLSSKLDTSYQDNYTLWRSDVSVSSNLVYGPNLPILDHQSHLTFPNSENDCVREINNVLKKDSTKTDLTNRHSDVTSVDNSVQDATKCSNSFKNYLSMWKVKNKNDYMEETKQIKLKRTVGEFQNELETKEVSSKLVAETMKKLHTEKSMTGTQSSVDNSMQGKTTIKNSSEELSSTEKVNDYNPSLVENQIQLKQTIQNIQNKRRGEIDSKLNNKYIKKSWSINTMTRVERPHQETKQVFSDQTKRKLHERPTASSYPSRQSNEHNRKNNRYIIEDDLNKSPSKQSSKENFNKHNPKQKYTAKTHIKKKEDWADKEKKYDYENKKKQKDKEHKSKWKVIKKETSEKKSENEGKFKKEFKHKYISKSEIKNELRHKSKHSYKKSRYESEKHYSRKPNKHIVDLKNKNYFQKLQKHKEQDNLRYHNPIAWSVDEHGYRFNNLSGEWLIKMNQARAKQREKMHRSDWVFDRAISRKMKREEDKENARWYFQRARSRETCRVEPDSDRCKTHEMKDSHKFDKRSGWKKNHNSDEDHDHYRRDWRVKYLPRHWRGTRFISNAFKTAMNFMKA